MKPPRASVRTTAMEAKIKGVTLIPSFRWKIWAAALMQWRLPTSGGVYACLGEDYEKSSLELAKAVRAAVEPSART